MGKHTFRGFVTSWDQIQVPEGIVLTHGLPPAPENPTSAPGEPDASHLLSGPGRSPSSSPDSYHPLSSETPKSPEPLAAEAGRGPTAEPRKRKGISMEWSEKIAREKGFPPAPRDHPIYSEGTTITFVRPRGQTKKGD